MPPRAAVARAVPPRWTGACPSARRRASISSSASREASRKRQRRLPVHHAYIDVHVRVRPHAGPAASISIRSRAAAFQSTSCVRRDDDVVVAAGKLPGVRGCVRCASAGAGASGSPPPAGPRRGRLTRTPPRSCAARSSPPASPRAPTRPGHPARAATPRATAPVNTRVTARGGLVPEDEQPCIRGGAHQLGRGMAGEQQARDLHVRLGRRGLPGTVGQQLAPDLAQVAGDERHHRRHRHVVGMDVHHGQGQRQPARLMSCVSRGEVGPLRAVDPHHHTGRCLHRDHPVPSMVHRQSGGPRRAGCRADRPGQSGTPGHLDDPGTPGQACPKSPAGRDQRHFSSPGAQAEAGHPTTEQEGDARGHTDRHQHRSGPGGPGQGRPRRRREHADDGQAAGRRRSGVDRAAAARLPGDPVHHRRLSEHIGGVILFDETVRPAGPGRHAVPGAAARAGGSFPGSRSTAAPGRSRGSPARWRPRDWTGCGNG